MTFLFSDRFDAGRYLASRLGHYSHRPDVLVLGLPRGGVPVAYEVARALDAPLDVFIVRKLGVPGHEELAMGAIATGAVRVLNPEIIRALQIPDDVLDRVTEVELEELRRREREYRGNRPPPRVQGQTAILIDDGLATGASMRAAVSALRRQEPAHLVVAVPTAARDTCADFQPLVDEIVCTTTPEPFLGVGRWYEDFSQMTDEEVRDILQRAWREQEEKVHAGQSRV